MAAVAPRIEKRWDWRGIVFRLVAGLLALAHIVLFSALPALSPWVQSAIDLTEQFPELHRWHNANGAALRGFLLGGSLVALLWRPREKPLLVQFYVLSVLFIMLSSFPDIEPLRLVFIGLILIAYPAPRSLLSFARAQRTSRSILALGLLMVPLLGIDAVRNLQLHLAGAGGEHFLHGHWSTAFQLDLVLIFGGLLTATRRPGWSALGVVTGLTFLYLGFAALALPNQDGSWGIAGGVAALLVGGAYIVLTLREAQAPAARS